jgi:hypothetical protein
MGVDHEYAILGGFNRAKVGHVVGAVAATVSAALVALVFILAGAAEALGLSGRVPIVVLVWVSAGTIYAALYWLFDRHVWKWGWVARVLRVPNLTGKWTCHGQTINPDKSLGDAWTGELVIIQSWDRICVRLATPQSTSKSISASLLQDEAAGFRLIYSYRNVPNIDEPQLASHLGHAEFLFDAALAIGRGEYFNGHGRYTFGTMRLARQE